MALSSGKILIPTILCGGVGSRLWPLSRAQDPKPLIRLNGKRSLLQDAYYLGTTLPDVREIVTVTNSSLFFRVEQDYNKLHSLSGKQIRNRFVLEPTGRNTAPAVAAASIQVAENYGLDATLLVLAADHLIHKPESFTQAVITACELAQEKKIVTFGIQPSAPETGYGYIEHCGTDVIRFVEKPGKDKAEEYVLSGNFLWNSGMFCFRAGTMLEEMEEHCPEIIERVRTCLNSSRSETKKDGTQLVELDTTEFHKVPDQSIDYALMEKTGNAAVVACNIGWSDIGCWRALGDQIKPDSNNNRIQGSALVMDSHDCTVTSYGNDRVIGLLGGQSLVVVDTPDALLIADKNRSQDVKKIFSQLKKTGHESQNTHRTVHRPWGTYTVLEEGPNFKIKRIEVKPGASLSLQMHNHRSEHWVVIQGQAQVINGDKIMTLGLDESTFIPATHKHRLENPGKEPTIIIEVQTGSYLGEDDIVRFNDRYGRVPCEA